MEESSNQHVVQCKNRLCGKEYHESFSECPFCGTKNGEHVPPGGFVKQATRDFNAVAHIFLGLTMFATANTVYVYGYDMSAYVLGQKTAIFIRDFCPFAIAMCFRKNGISGWKSMLASEKYVKEHTKI